MRLSLVTKKICLFMLLSSPCWADPIRLRSGSLSFESPLYGDGPVHLEGSRGFIFDGYAYNARLDADCGYTNCDAGQTISIYLSASGNDLPGSATLDGNTYNDIGGFDSLNSLTIEINGAFRAPRMGRTDTRTKTVKGAVSGRFCHNMMCEMLGGAALATVELYKYDGGWSVDSIEYDVMRR